jgi:hypothetical protein
MSSKLDLVVSYTLRTIPLGRYWAENIIYPVASTYDKQFQAFSDFTGNLKYNEDAALQMSISFGPNFGVIFVDQSFYTARRSIPRSSGVSGDRA